MDASSYTAPTAAAERPADDTCEAEITRVFRRPSPQAQRRLSLMAQAAGDTARALKAR